VLFRSAENEGGTVQGNTISSTTGSISTATLAKSTCLSAAGAVSPWLFDGNYSIANSNGKGYASGSQDGIKLSTDVNFTVNLPVGIYVTKVKFVGYNNYAGTDAYISELNGTSYGLTDYVFTQKDASGNAIICTNEISLTTPASGSFAFLIKGNQVVVSIILTIATATGVRTEKIISADPNSLVNVYDIYGRLIRSKIVMSEATEGLPYGLYIVNGKKIAVFNN
jgi:hypothetical protein